jgi:hypothetical protein
MNGDFAVFVEARLDKGRIMLDYEVDGGRLGEYWRYRASM